MLVSKAFYNNKKVLNWKDLGIKLRYSLEKKTFMGNENILPKFLIAAKKKISKSQYSIWTHENTH